MAHCSATPEGRDVRPEHILQMHLGPRSLFKEGKSLGVVYKGKTYPNRAVLPAEFIGGVSIHKLNGRGWIKPGYRHFIDIMGVIHDLAEYDDDAFLEDFEITNGAAGWNGKTIHFCTAGGLDQNMKTKDTRNPAQLKSQEALVIFYLAHNPQLKLIGHNQVAKKDCPSYYVPQWAKQFGIGEKNIETRHFV